jgi:NAD(P) transhydrogenase subunit alpha
MRIAVLREGAAGETRVAATPETVRKFIALGAAVAVERGAGEAASIPDALYEDAGADLGLAAEVVEGAHIVLGVQAPDPAALAGAVPGAWVAAMFDPFGERARVDAYASAGLEALAMEFMPRITRAQSMDVMFRLTTIASHYASLFTST